MRVLSFIIKFRFELYVKKLWVVVFLNELKKILNLLYINFIFNNQIMSMYTSFIFSDKYLNQKLWSYIFKEILKFIWNLKTINAIYGIMK